MAEQSLYRRHRPQSFAEVVGQEHVVRTLSNAIERDRVHHAYLFVGSRGTGKTSMAKILAKSLNCVNGPTLTPCGECESCVTIAAGGSMDVIEMDAASNRSVDDIRELRERVGYAPAGGHWKVYILDEAHMLTREAWNAFLKTLEEPPPNTVFVLATTEAHKVMATIVDRCQRFDFGRPSPEEIAVVLRRASGAEGISLDDGALAAIARAANGSFRDALGTLDQLVAYSGNEIATDDVLAVLGVADAELIFAATDAIASGDGRAALTVSSDLARSGRDPARFASDLVGHLRQLLVIATLDEIPEHFLLVEEHRVRLSEQARSLSEVALLRAIDNLAAATTAIREGDEARMTVELALLRSARPEIDPTRAAMADRLERLERAVSSSGAGAGAGPPGVVAAARAGEAPAAEASAPAGGSPPATPPVSETPATPPPEAAVPASIAHGAVEIAEQARRDAGAAAGAEEPPGHQPDPTPPEAAFEGAAAPPRAEAPAEPNEAPSDQAEAPAEPGEAPAEPTEAPGAQADEPAEPDEPPGAPPVDLDRVAGLWPSVVEHMRQSGAGLLAAAFDAAKPVAVDPQASVLEVGFAASAAFNRRKAEAKENRERVLEAVRTVLGTPLRPVFVTLPEEEHEEAAEPALGVDDEGAAERDLVEQFVSEFDAEVLTDDDDGTALPDGMAERDLREGTS